MLLCRYRNYNNLSNGHTIAVSTSWVSMENIFRIIIKIAWIWKIVSYFKCEYPMLSKIYSNH